MPVAHALIIDDSWPNIEVLTTLLDKEDVTYTTTVLPREVPELARSLDQVDVVFLDLEMPHQSGFDVLYELEAIDKLQGVPIVAYSVHNSEIDLARDAGFHSFLGKPLSVQLFPEQLQCILSGGEVWYISYGN